MRRYVVELDQLYAELLKDAAYAYPALRAEFGRDLTRLTRLSSSRGLPFYLVDLPKLGKHLDRCLSVGQYTPSGLPASKPIGGGVGIPVLFRGLYLLIFDRNGCLKEHADAEALLFLRTLLYCAKRASLDCPLSAKQQAVANYIEVDGSLPEPPACWRNPSQDGILSEYRGFMPQDSVREEVFSRFGKLRGSTLLRNLDRIAGIVSLTLGHYDPLDWDFRHGPGSVSDKGQTGDRYKDIGAVWPAKLETVFPIADAAYHSYSSWADDALAQCLDKPLSSKLAIVRKDYTKPRLIASEPSAHMWCQQNIRHFIYERVDKSWIGDFISFRDQFRNREMARLGSLFHVFATIDLSEASDRVSCLVVGNAFRANYGLLSALIASRTHTIDICKVPMELRKYSTMGNATTFPVQSLIFLMCSLSCCVKGEVTPASLAKCVGLVSVFGDDIVVPEVNAVEVVNLLEALGFKVNTAKSFLTGPFKESCGIDAFRGVDVTPAYWHGPCDKTPESIASSVETANNFYKKFFVNASAFIERGVQKHIKVPWCHAGSGAFAFNSFCCPPVRAKRRWNPGLQIEECQVPVLSSSTKVRKTEVNTFLLQYFTEEPSPWDPWEGGARSRPHLKLKKRWVPTAQFTEPIM